MRGQATGTNSATSSRWALFAHALRCTQADHTEPFFTRLLFLTATSTRQSPSLTRRASNLEAILFIGLPASGKSSFYKERFFGTHVRISRDLLKTPHRCERMLQLCLETDQRFVIDNTNPTALDRAPFVAAARARSFRVDGYYFQSRIADCLARNAQRTGDEHVAEAAILTKAKQLELPRRSEEFDRLFYVRMEDGRFVVEEWQDEI